MNPKNVYVIAGPNGSGKTTFATQFLPDFVNCPNFINADLIAKGLAPFGPERAVLKAGIDNSGASPVLIAERKNENMRIFHKDLFNAVQKQRGVK